MCQSRRSVGAISAVAGLSSVRKCAAGIKIYSISRLSSDQRQLSVASGVDCDSGSYFPGSESTSILAISLPVKTIEAGHYVFLLSTMAAVMALIDKEQVASVFKRHNSSYAQQAIAQQKSNQRLIELLQTSGRHQFERVLEVGAVAPEI